MPLPTSMSLSARTARSLRRRAATCPTARAAISKLRPHRRRLRAVGPAAATALAFPRYEGRELFIGLEDEEGPSVGDQIAIGLDEDGTPAISGSNPGGPGDDADAPTVLSGTLIYNFGDSGPAGTDPIVFDTNALNALSLQSGGDPVVWAWDGASLTLTGTVGGNTIVELVINDLNTGAYTVTLSGPIDHEAPESGSFENEVAISPFDGTANGANFVSAATLTGSPSATSITLLYGDGTNNHIVTADAVSWL
jgi:hypothetical protein